MDDGQHPGGYAGRILDVDLTAESFGVRPLPRDLARSFVGGKVLAARLLFDAVAPGVDPLGPENALVFTTGPLTGTGAPAANRFNVSCKNVLTGGIASSNCGGDFGMYLKRAGFDAVVIRGCARAPTWLQITENGASFRNARHLWGLDTEAVAAGLPKKTGAVTIGPAGENLVRFAAIVSGERVAGRCGVGAVMGSKRLKLVTASGGRRPSPCDREGFRKAVRAHVATLRKHSLTGQMLPRFGTAALVTGANATYTMPTHNFQAGRFEHAARVSGERMAAEDLARNGGCTGCPIHCGRVVRHRGSLVKGPEYETMGMFGANIGNPHLDRIYGWNHLADRLGMDTISLGATVAAAMELKERGLFPELPVSFGQTDALDQLIQDVAWRRGVGDDLADGSMRLASRKGAPELAMQSKGLEFAAYEPRGAVGHGLGYATSNRGGCHINGGYLIFFEALGPVTMDPLTPVGKPAMVVLQQDLLEAVSAAGGCIFTTYAIVPDLPTWVYGPHGVSARIVNASLKASRLLLPTVMRHSTCLLPIKAPQVPHAELLETLTGLSMSLGRFLETGRRGFTLERLFNLREGLLGDSDALPPRLTEMLQRPGISRSRVPLGEMLPVYYAARGWTTDGVPTERLLRQLGLSDFRDVVEDAISRPDVLRARRALILESEDARLRSLLEANRAFASISDEERAVVRREVLRDASRERARRARKAGSFSVDEAACRACGLCVTSCPVSAIRWSPSSKATIDVAVCLRCGCCEEACPPHFAAIRSPPAEDGGRDALRFRIVTERCGRCGICARQCPVGAIRWNLHEVAVIDDELCVACGRCLEVCPSRFAAVLQQGREVSA
jgi:aldehyde:ferredoxin oxidoreductase